MIRKTMTTRVTRCSKCGGSANWQTNAYGECQKCNFKRNKVVFTEPKSDPRLKETPDWIKAL